MREAYEKGVEMTTESRSAFEAWAHKNCYAATEGQWDAWQASRKQALEVALEICKDASCANQSASHCYHEIKELMKWTKSKR